MNRFKAMDCEVLSSTPPLSYLELSQPTSNDNSTHAELQPTRSGLVARLNLFDATMIVMGGIVGAGIFFGLSATCLFVFRARDVRAAASGQAGLVSTPGYRVPGHPWTTGLFSHLFHLGGARYANQKSRMSELRSNACLALNGVGQDLFERAP